MLTADIILDRLNAVQKSPFLTSYGFFSADQQMARLNECLDIIYVSDSWRGVRAVTPLTAVTGIISLPAGLLRAEKRISAKNADDCYLGFFEIKPLEYQYQTGGPGVFDMTRGCCLGVAIDLGDDSTGARRYQLSGDPAILDTYTYSAVCRLRFLYITNTSDRVIPDCYAGIEMGVRAMSAADANDNELSQQLWAQAFARLDSDLGQYEQGNDPGVMQLDPAVAMDNHCPV